MECRLIQVNIYIFMKILFVGKIPRVVEARPEEAEFTESEETEFPESEPEGELSQIVP